MAILVHDTEWKPAGLQPASSLSRSEPAAASLKTERWLAGPASDWRHTESGWTLRGGERSDWLEFASGPASKTQPGEIVDGPQRDDDAYNLNSSRKLNDVADLSLVAQVSAIGDGQLRIRASSGSEQFLVALRPNTGELSLARNGKIIDTVKRSAAYLQKPSELVVSLIDRQVLVAIDGRTELTYPFENDREKGDATRFQIESHPQFSRPFAIAAEGLSVRVDRLQIWRDIYITAPLDPRAATVCRLADDEFFAIGDNSPASRDSRNFTGGEPFKERLLIGKPLHTFRRH